MAERKLGKIAAKRLASAAVALALALGAGATGLGGLDVAAAKSLKALPKVKRACDCDVVVIRVGKAYPIELSRQTRDVLISDPAIVDVVLRTARQPVLFGKKIGQANILFFDEANKKVRAVEVRVEYDAPSLAGLIRRQFPKAQVTAESTLGEVVLSGTVRSSAEAKAIELLAQRFVANARAARSKGDDKPLVDPKSTGVVNRIVVLNEEQVYLQVRIAEVSRSILKELGVDWNAGLQNASISSVIGIKAGNFRNFLSAGSSEIAFGPQLLSSFIKALEQYSLVHTLAEPSLTAVSGESASFLAGGEFPIPVPDGQGSTTIEFKRFGVGLDFTPVVLSGGRISLKISTEVSALSDNGSIVLNGFNVPALTVRRAKSTVEINSGGTLMIAGLIQSDTKRLSAGLPGLRTLPVLGKFFRNENIEKNETELVVLVTPYTVRPEKASKFTLPTDGFAPASDFDVYLFGRLHSVYGKTKKSPKVIKKDVEKVSAAVGYILE